MSVYIFVRSDPSTRYQNTIVSGTSTIDTLWGGLGFYVQGAGLRV